MKLCNCGEKMVWDFPETNPKIYVCHTCGATLQITKSGITKWFDKNGKQGTYSPPDPSKITK